MKILRPAYKIFRGIVMTLVVLLVVLYAALYVSLSIPSCQNKLRDIACRELSGLLGGEFSIKSMTIRPFSEILLNDIALDAPDGKRCASISTVAAGIDVWQLITKHRIVLNYAEIMGLDFHVWQKSPDSPTNIQFLIDALTPKDKKRPPASFDLRIRNVVVRKSKASFSRLWLMSGSEKDRRFAVISLDGLRMNLSIPELRNDLYRFDIRNMQFDLSPGISVRRLSADVAYSKDSVGSNDRLSVSNFSLAMPSSSLAIADIDINPRKLDCIDAVITGNVTPSDFTELLPQLNDINTSFDLNLDVSVKGKELIVSDLKISHKDTESYLELQGEAKVEDEDTPDVDISRLKVDFAPTLIRNVIMRSVSVPAKAKHILEAAGRVRVDLEGKLSGGNKAEGKGNVTTDKGSLDFEGSVDRIKSHKPITDLSVVCDNLELGELLNTYKLGMVSFDADVQLSGIDKNCEGLVSLVSDHMTVMDQQLSYVELELEKQRDDISLVLEALSDELQIIGEANAHLKGEESTLQSEISVLNLVPSRYGMKGTYSGSEVSATLQTYLTGNNINNVTGRLRLLDLSVEKQDGNELYLPKLSVEIDRIDGESGKAKEYVYGRDIKIKSDWLDATIYGDIVPGKIRQELETIAGKILPTLLPEQELWNDYANAENDFVFDINIKGNQEPYEFFHFPIRPLADIPVKGKFDARNGVMQLETSTPHLLQGADKLIRDTSLKFHADSSPGIVKLQAGLIYPAKKGDIQLAADLAGANDAVNIDLNLNPSLKSSIKGGVSLGTTFRRLPDPYNPQGTLAVNVDIRPSSITVGGTDWKIADGMVDYSGKRISVNNFLVGHENQYVKIDGIASENANDKLKVKLRDIDLEYIFNILNINYVSFGGMATGEVTGSQLLTQTPNAKTDYLRVKDFSYNGAMLGDADLASEYEASEQKIGIYAVVRDPLTKEKRVNVDGGIWVTRDSLSFNFDANKVNAELMKPFMAAFCTGLSGTASGKCKLYGGFQDVDLVGALKADTLNLKLGFTNTWYHAGGDSVFLLKGLIDIPPLTLYDDEGHTAELSGWLKHRYFHDPVFNFRVRDAKSLLCYNTNKKMNPLWYGTIYGSGGVQINGHPGLVDIDINMTTEEGSKFYYVISDTEDVAQYSFLTFTDKKKEKMKAAQPDSVPDYLKKFHKEIQKQADVVSNVIVSIKGTVTNDALVTLLMDPTAGDNISARGQGALQMDYNMASNDLRMIGNYVIDEGNYNFTLQDIIIKNFNIRKGSVIKFDGDPMDANLDIAATYRVNTNLTDLDKSFSTDKELNRTNVPVDALLLVKGPLTNPEINFDIELPSLTSDVERKVKSIISTNDMMSRQIIYLLALNRFYTPEYTGTSSTGGEWSSMASSTISSQLSNILSQMTDKLAVAPSFRSDKGDFTDLEFDLALSSRLLNNRLLVNGNFGYRDRSTSNTQFVGDFDIEYLLNKNGNLRLKAYNHFNDQNYYLRSALTTQGVGVVFRRDFDRLFSRKREPSKGKTVIEVKDSLLNMKKDTITITD